MTTRFRYALALLRARHERLTANHYDDGAPMRDDGTRCPECVEATAIRAEIDALAVVAGPTVATVAESRRVTRARIARLAR